MSLVALKPNKDLPYISKLFEDGKLKCVIDEKRFRLEDAREAMHYFGSGDHKGKVVISLK